jgi:hypothetical protein
MTAACALRALMIVYFVILNHDFSPAEFFQCRCSVTLQGMINDGGEGERISCFEWEKGEVVCLNLGTSK